MRRRNVNIEGCSGPSVFYFIVNQRFLSASYTIRALAEVKKQEGGER